MYSWNWKASSASFKTFKHKIKIEIRHNILYFLTKFELTSLTPILAFADVSMKEQLLNCLARLSPWSLPTTRSSSRSHLLPTSTIGTSSVSYIRKESYKYYSKLKFMVYNVWAFLFKETWSILEMDSKCLDEKWVECMCSVIVLWICWGRYPFKKHPILY